ncbi:GAP family protein [Streptomyces sp. NPDC056149]|uniref:GAP family protein n=1 Tax=unclassified Streptomyces TaxID=2593676 RepID=UPI002381755C|nr:GAP family protein [Streptomyces sp. WZ-12]
MSSVLGEVVPPALGIALSPFPVIPAILLLFTRRPRATGSAFLTGWVIGIAVPTGVFTVLASVIEQHEETPTWASWVRIALGAILLAVGIPRWFNPPQKKSAPQWMRSLERSTPAPALRLGLLLSAANPKILLLAMAGGLSIGAAGLPAAGTVTAVVVFTAIAACTVALPPLLHALLGERIDAPLRRAKDWLEVHNATVMTLVITVIGMVLIAEGCATLWNQR